MKLIKLWIPILSASLLMIGCATQQTAPVIKQPVKDVNATQSYAPAPPKKKIELKEVEDTNFSSEYMYPETKTKKEKPVAVAKTDSTEVVTPAVSTSSMGKGECISMIGQVKFDKYTQMLGDEASAIKRCQMLKAM
jgi:hypothetical protein